MTMLADVISLFVTLVLHVHPSVEICTPIDSNMRRIQEFNDKRITESALWITNLPMSLCLEKCILDYRCLSVNISPEDESCIGFDEVFEGLDAQMEAVGGYQLFEITPSFVCTHCSTIFGNSNCYGRPCRCNIGYSLFEAACRATSECVSISNDYSVYAGYVKWMYDFAEYTDQTVSSCATLCNNEASCVTAGYMLSTKKCWLGNTTWYETGNRYNNADYLYIQRECRW